MDSKIEEALARLYAVHDEIDEITLLLMNEQPLPDGTLTDEGEIL